MTDRSVSSRESDARLIEAMIDQFPWREHAYARMALAIAASAVRRGRHLTEDEKLENLAKAAEDDMSECATQEEIDGMREFAQLLRSKIAGGRQ